MRLMSSPKQDVEWLQREIEENRLILNETRQKRLKVEEEIQQMRIEIKERNELMLQSGEVIYALQQFQTLLQEERNITEQLNNEAAADGKEKRELQERVEFAQIKIRSLSDEKLKMEQRLQKTKYHHAASQDSYQPPTTRSKKKKIPK